MAARPYTKAPPPAIAAVYDWSGFYIGGNGGYGTTRNCWNFVSFAGAPFGAGEGCHDSDGAVAGGQIGNRWQCSAFVFGLEAQGNWADLRGSRVSSPAFVIAPGDLTINSRLRAFGLFTGQVGYAWNNVLLYVKGGAAVVDNSYFVVREEGRLHAGLSRPWGKSAVRNRCSKRLSQRMRRRKL